MATIYRNSYTRNGQKFTHSRWYIKYKRNGRVFRVPGHADREATEALARRLEQGTPYADSLISYGEYLRRNCSQKHAKQTVFRISAFGFTDFRQLSSASAAKMLPKNQKTASYYAQALRSFINWAIREGILEKNPILNLRISLKSYKPTLIRRSLTAGEIEQLLGTQKAAFRGLKAADRVALYRTALNTGFRAQELASLTPSHLTPAGLILLSTDTKNGKAVTQPLSPAFHSEFAAYVCDFDPDAKLWPGSWWRRAKDMFQRDCRCDADFHCLRVTYITELVRMGYFPKQVQSLARHSTMELTMRYYAKLTPSDFNLSGLWQ